MEYEETYVNFPSHDVSDFSGGYPHQNDKIKASTPSTDLFTKECAAAQKPYPWTKILISTLSIVCILLLAIVIVVLFFYSQLSQKRSKEAEEEEAETLKANITKKTDMYNDILAKYNGILNNYSSISAEYYTLARRANDQNKENEDLKTRIQSFLKNFNVTKDAVCIQPIQGNICELCPFKWTSFRKSDTSGSKSSCYFTSTTEKSWDESRKACKEMDADLVVINSREEKNVVASLTKSEMFWIGLTDREREGRFKWVDGTHLTTPTFWRDSEPNNLYPNDPDGEDCVIEQDDWNDASCARHFKWICEQDARHILMET
ncbi:CD209 antigen-like protein B isoform X2 [Protopterus annectens]|uniref:CD209 antigen-like protein B isoform X2 n=1 Tax=Protopterus annectens TaxID=7888 RepID=UPI001CFBB6C4|nr:CD209 antigen-like protein B isoform X2 [Protopterus annectens]